MITERLIIGRSLTVNTGNFESDKIRVEMEVRLDEHEDPQKCIADLIDRVNDTILKVHES